MKGYSVVLFVFLVGVHSHTTVWNATVNGVTKHCMRQKTPDSEGDKTGRYAQWPVTSIAQGYDFLAQDDYTCGFMPWAGEAANEKCTVAAGDTISVNYYHGYASSIGENAQDDNWIASSHRGPFMAYLTKWDQSGGLPTGNVWFKIFETSIIKYGGGDWDSNSWAIPDILNANSGAMSFKIPSDLAPGNYLLRTENIAYHDSSPKGRQPYVSCAELVITGSGTANPAGTAQFPGSYDWSDAGLSYNLYNADPSASYPYPGSIPLYVEGTTPTPTPTPTPNTPPTPPTPTPTPPTPSYPNGIASNTIIEAGRKIWDVTNTYFAYQQNDGNLVVYDTKWTPLWASGSYRSDQSTYVFIPQADGNLVIYETSSGTFEAVWSTSTNGKGTGPYTLVMQSDKNLVYYDSTGSTIWTTGIYAVDVGVSPDANPYNNMTGGHQFNNVTGAPELSSASGVSACIMATFAILVALL